MDRLIAFRLMQSLVLMAAMSVVVFMGVYAIGDPLLLLLPNDASFETIERTRSTLGLDKPLYEQYFLFLTNVLRGDFGTSFVYNESALKIIIARLPATIEIAVVAILLAILIGLPLGLYAGLRPGTPAARFILSVSLFGFGLPSFWIGLMMIVLFAVELGWLPSGGRGPTVEVFGIGWSVLTIDGWKHLFMPALTIALLQISLVIRLTSAGVQEVLASDYVRFARAKGLGEGRIILIHMLPNVFVPIITVLSMELGSIIAFATVTETVFAWPGIGKLIIDSINSLDRPLIVAYLIFTVFLVVILNLFSDIVVYWLDPRARDDSRA